MLLNLFRRNKKQSATSSRGRGKRFGANGRRSRFTQLAMEQLEQRTLLAVNILNNAGLGSFGIADGSTPPDTCGAAGPNSYIEVVNGTIGIFDKAGAPLTSHGIFDFFYNPVIGAESLITPGSCGVCDSTIVFDNLMGADGRFIIGDIDVDYSAGVNVSQYIFAVSTTSNPTALDAANWNFYHITTTTGPAGNTEWTDYPGNFGFNADAVVETFNKAQGGFLTNNALVLSIDASDLAAGVSNASLHYNLNSINGSRDYRATTMHDAAPGDPMWLVRNPGDGSHINVTKMTNVLSNAASFTTTSLALPAGDTFQSGDVTVRNADSSAINDVGTRILKAGEYNNTVVATHKIRVSSTEADVQWYAIDVSGANPAFQMLGGQANIGRIGFGANTYAYDPGVDINARGEIGISFTQSDTNGGSANALTGGNPSMFVTGRNITDPAGAVENIVLVPVGTGFGNIAGRSGDFSGMNIDPVDGTFWAANGFGNGTAAEPTAIAHFSTSGLLTPVYPNVTIRVNPSDATQIQVLAGIPPALGPVLNTYANNSTTVIAIAGDGSNNTVVIDETYGVVNAPISFTGNGSPGAPGDQMILYGTSGDDTVDLSGTAPNIASMTFNAATYSHAIYSFAGIQQFAFDGQAGNDTLTVDSSSALVDVSAGVLFDGGAGFNKLKLTQTGGATQTSDVYSVGPNPGEGSSVITGPGGVQAVYFQNLAPVQDNVPATPPPRSTAPTPPTPSITNRAPAAASSSAPPASSPSITRNPIEFNNKTNLVIDARAGSDEINLHNPNTPTGLTNITCRWR